MACMMIPEGLEKIDMFIVEIMNASERQMSIEDVEQCLFNIPSVP